jgi:hypothetical protein
MDPPANHSNALFSNTAQATLVPPLARRQERQWQSVLATGSPATR